MEKFSGSVNKFGNSVEIINKIKNINKNPTMSLEEKKGWKEILSVLELIPEGFEEPVSWRNTKWKTTKAKIMKGNKKWKEKKRVKVGLSTENPPQIHSTKVFPK